MVNNCNTETTIDDGADISITPNGGNLTTTCSTITSIDIDGPSIADDMVNVESG